MKTAMARRLAAAFLLGAVFVGQWAFGNGGPFVVKYPSGDPAAKGVLARLEPTLKPAQETRLRVLKEDLTVRFKNDPQGGDTVVTPPLAEVTAAYTIENPTDAEIQVDFGFPILRGIYLILGMSSYPDVSVTIDKQRARATLISNSAIYGMIRQNAREAIEKDIAADAKFARLVAAVREASHVVIEPPQANRQEAPQEKLSDIEEYFSAGPAIPKTKSQPIPTADYVPARKELLSYLVEELKWNARDAALLVEYASLDLGKMRSAPRDRWDNWVYMAEVLTELKTSNLGPLAAIGEQKATQLFAQLAARFDKEAGSNYEAIFKAWGGDVRERSIDLATGEIRPREVTLPTPVAATGRPANENDRRLTADPTVYARVDYLDPEAKINPTEKASCEAVLKNLPVTFTFAPMNLLHYQVKFPARGTHVVTVQYSQYAYADTRGPGSYQLAYVLHPATLWKEFGPIHVQVQLPKGVPCRASTPMVETDECTEVEASKRDAFLAANIIYAFTLTKPQEKSGEMMVGLDKTEWDKMAKRKAEAKQGKAIPRVNGSRNR